MPESCNVQYVRIYTAIRFHQIQRTVFNSLKYISRLLLKDLETKKCICKIFCFDYKCENLT